MSLWCALDDTSGTPERCRCTALAHPLAVENGTLFVPSRGAASPADDSAPKRPRIADEPAPEADGVPLTAAAGDCVAFSSLLWHRSSPNRSDRCRRVYYAQFSTVPITPSTNDPVPLAYAVPLRPALSG